MYITEYILQQLRFHKQFAWGKVTYKSQDGVYTWYPESKTLYFKGNNRDYFSEKGKFLGNIVL